MKAEVGVVGDEGEARLFERGIVVGVEVVDADDRLAAVEQRPRDVVADEARRAGDLRAFSPIFSSAE
jgi:hypothetical protein